MLPQAVNCTEQSTAVERAEPGLSPGLGALDLLIGIRHFDSAGPLEALHRMLVELPTGAPQIGLELLQRAGADDRRRHARLLQEPVDRHLSWRLTGFLGHGE